ncbi:putative ATP-dependent RNA helicase TDRD12 isoform X2 [Folsomia candida]|uniref:RNA helicase n=1 Tax=Folsomia candida TaxID=158441 RepID=A0A226EXD0_FOLCA|nr:putative ATP-dependent RNA helicase TDRD12 isoform X2 [Folsomia candida]OXA61734.1 putative ATP-dependent RNA helicase TDRD12 [Folsomia candida]
MSGSDSGKATTVGSEDKDNPGSNHTSSLKRRPRAAIAQNFSSIYHGKGLGGRGRTSKDTSSDDSSSSSDESDSSSNKICLDIASPQKRVPNSNPKCLDADDFDLEDLPKNEVANYEDSPCSSKSIQEAKRPVFVPIKLINKPGNIIKHNGTSPLDLPGRVLIRGPLLMSPLALMAHFTHYKTLVKGIQTLGLADFNALQKSVAPHFLRGDDCFITGGLNSGKSLSYIFPLLGKLLSEFDDQSFSSSHKLSSNRHAKKSFSHQSHEHQPVVLIVCTDRTSAIKIDGHLYRILLACNRRELSHAVICNGGDRKTVHKCLDIVITSAHFLSNLLHNSPAYFGFENLRFIVYKDVDILLRANNKEFEHIQYIMHNIASKHSPYLIQRVFCGKDWCPEVEALYMNLKPIAQNSTASSVPIVFINSPNQAIKYSGMQWFMHHCSDDERMDLLLNILKSLDLYKHKSIFVVCSTPEIAINVHKELKRNEIYACLAETGTMTQAVFHQLRIEWEDFPVDRRLMVLNDEMLKGLRIYDVTCLIHFDIPSAKPGGAVDRFSCMWMNFRDIANEKVDRTVKFHRKELAAHFLLTGNEENLYKLKTFAANLRCDIPQSLVVIADQMGENIMSGQPICTGIKVFGRCVETVPSNCKTRHSFLLTELEKKSVVPRNGEIEVQISECVNPSVYTARVLRCYEFVDNKRKLRFSWIQNFRSISEELMHHFKDKDNRIPPTSFEIGTLCAVESSDEIFRSRILQIITRTDSKRPQQLRVFCIDSGNFLQPVADKLFKLPETLSAHPQLAIELILGNLQPIDGANGYESRVNEKAQELTLGKILLGKIVFAVGETVWVNPLIDVGRDAVGSTIKTRCSIRLDLIKKKWAENNDDHLKNILNLCRKTGYSCPELDDVHANLAKNSLFMSKFHNIGDEYQWAFVATSSVEKPQTVEIWTSFTIDPSCIIGTNGKFDSQLNAVNKELNDHISEMISDRCPDYAKEFSSYYQEGMVVAVKDQIDQSWYRGLITHVRENEENIVYDVFLVDIGDTKKSSPTAELFPILQSLVTKLPFQAIIFELAHITPTNGNNDWDSEVIDCLTSLTIDENNDGVMFDVVAWSTRRHEHFPCRCYSAFMITSSGDELGELLVLKNAASVRFVKDDEDLKLAKKNILTTLNELYDRQQVELGSDEELPDSMTDSDSDNSFDVVGYDRNSVLNSLGIQLPGGIQVPSSELNEADEIELQPTTNDKSVVSSSHPDAEGGAKSASQEMPAVESHESTPVGGFSTLKHPTVVWRQTMKEFILKVNQADILKYSIDINKKRISFRTLDPPDYGFDIDCFGTIEQVPVVFCTGQYLKITLTKRSQWPWPRPLHRHLKLRWLKEDIQDLDISDDEHVTNSNDENIHPIVLPDEEKSDSSDSELDDVEDFMGEVD